MKDSFKYIQVSLLHFVATVLFSFLHVVAVAQVKFNTVVTDRQPALSDYVQVEFTIENAKSVEKVSAPAFKSFRVVQGPIQSDGMSYVNGVMSQYKSVSFILQPLVAGKVTIPGATALIDGRPMQSAPVVIEIKNQGGSKRNNAPTGITSLFPREEPAVEEEYMLKPGENFTEKIKNNLLVRTDVNKTTCYEGEPIMATFTLCSRLKSESKVLKRPSLNGFSVYDMADPESYSPTVQPVNGRPFNVHLIRKTQLIPLQPGTYTIDPVELENTVRFIRKTVRQQAPKSRMQQLMDDIMNEGVQGTLEEHTFTLASKPVLITVKPLPDANKPEGFNGAVGKFIIKAKLKDQAVAAGDAAVLQVQIKGQGNFSVINPPALPLPHGMEGYEPVVKELVEKSVYPLSGTKTFEYTFIAKDTGTYIIPAIVFSYFDPSDARYKTTVSDPVEVRVAPSKKKRRLIFGNADNNTSSSRNPIAAYPAYVPVLAIAVLLLAGLGLYRMRKKPRKKVSRQPAPVTKPVMAPAADLLQDAKSAMQQGKSQQFYSQVNNAVWSRLSEKLHMPASELNKYNVFTQLQGKGVDAGLVATLQTVLNECEMALYTPDHSDTDMQRTLVKAEEILKALQHPIT